jgi:triosephosphate isomerase
VRTRLIVGNWKLNKTPSEARAFTQRLKETLPQNRRAELVVAPPFPALQAVRDALGQSSGVLVGAQDLFWEDQGAFTGEVSAPMLKDLGCRYVLIGHSERRQWFGERDETVAKKVKAALRHEVVPIVCVGESVAEREADRTEDLITSQVEKGIGDCSAHAIQRMVIAYEPIWAIGTGRAATPEQASAVHQMIRRLIAKQWGSEAAQALRILYGGSVTPQNVAGFLAAPDVDGALVGGACLDPDAFAKIAALAEA